MVLTDGRDPALFEGPDESLSLAFQSGVYITGGSGLYLDGEFFISGNSIESYFPTNSDASTEDLNFYEITGVKGIVSETGLIITDGRPTGLFQGPDESLSLAFQSGVYITGGADLHVEGRIFADEIESLDSIVGESGAMVLTDGRDPALFEGPDESLSLAFQSGVYITGGADLHVEGRIFADEIEALDSIVGESGAMVLTDGRDPALFEGPDESLSLAFQSGVYITGGADLHVEGRIFADEIESLDSIVGESGAMVLTDGRDSALFEGPDESLALAFNSGVFITGGSGLYIDGELFISGKSIESYFPANSNNNNNNSSLVTDPDVVYITGAQTIQGGKKFLEPITGSLSGEALYVKSGVYTSGDQQITGIKNFVGDLLISGKAVTKAINEVVVSTNNNYNDITTLLNWSYYQDDIVTGLFKSGVYISGDQEITGAKNFVGDLLISGSPIESYFGSSSPTEIDEASFTGVVSITGDQTISGRKDFEGDLFVSGVPFTDYISPKFYETINSNFWWNFSTTGVYLPIASAGHFHYKSQGNASKDAMGATAVESGMRMENIKLMNTAGKVKGITFSVTKTNPHGIPNPQFDIISGKAIDYNCQSISPERVDTFYFLDELGRESIETIESTNFSYPQWEDTYNIYKSRVENAQITYPCCYPLNPAGGTPANYNSPQKYISYTYDFVEPKHFEKGTYLAVLMNKGGVTGVECNQGDIDQAIFVSMIIENEI
jgi:hypothetical protein